MIKRNYKVCVSFGDGKPVSTVVAARGGIEAIDKAKSLHPGCRNVYMLGLSEDQELAVSHPFFDDPFAFKEQKEDPASYIKDRQVQLCLKMRAEGKTHQAIAGHLGVGKTTVGSWLKQYG